MRLQSVVWEMPVTSRSFAGAIRLTASVVAVFALVACSSSAGQSTGPSPKAAASSAAESGLEGVLWKLAEYVGPEGTTVPVPQAISASATFAAGRLSGNAGCNDYTGSYTVDGSKLTIGQIATTMKACGPAETAVETAYLAALGRVATYSVGSGTLDLKTAEGKVGIHFVATEAASLTKTRWVATSVNNGKGGVTSLVAGTSLTAIFTAAGSTVAGSGGCNDYNGPYTSDATTIKIGPLATTRKVCGTPAGVDDQEIAIPRCDAEGHEVHHRRHQARAPRRRRRAAGGLPADPRRRLIGSRRRDRLSGTQGRRPRAP